MELPPLSPDEINKFDQLLSFLKENNNNFIDIHTYCTDKWGTNHQLYISFARHLEINGLTIVSNYSESVQMISQRGLKITSFKSEYKKLSTDKSIKKFEKYFDLVSKPILALIAILGFLFGAYQQLNVNKYETTIDRQEKSIDSLNKIVQSLKQDSINKYPTQMDKTKKVNTSKVGY